MKKISLVFFPLLCISTALFSQPGNSLSRELSRQAPSALELYKQLHRSPELSRNEENTSRLLKKQMLDLGFRIIDSLGYFSFAAVLSNGPGPVVMYRTDMDGLPVLEETGLSYASKATALRGDETLPTMHACGHDVHMSVWLTTAKVLHALRKSWSGTLVFIAQSAEESGQGAKAIINSPAFRQIPKPDYQLGMHSHYSLPSGTVGLCDGYALAAADMMNITIFGRGGHGAAPEKCIDPILIASQFVNQVQSIISRNLSSNDPAVITVGSFHGGTIHNVIPDRAELKLTIRTYSESSRSLVLERIKTIGDNLALAAGMSKDHLPKYELLDMSIPPVFNDAGLGNKIKDIITKEPAAGAFEYVKPVMIGEDFSYYRKAYDDKVPSYLLWMGTIGPERKADPAANLPTLHSSKYYPDADKAIPDAVRIMSTSILGLLKP